MATMLKFTQEHEWIRLDGDIATIGITLFAQEQLGELVFVELPEIGKGLRKGTTAAVVESVKAASEVYAPISGKVIETNAAVIADPSLVNSDPMESGWMFKVKVDDAREFEEFMDEATYRAQFG
jgi:glycine cleavage system H protein